MLKAVLIAIVLSLIINISVAFSQDNLPKAVIVAKNAKKNTITIRNLDTGQRHTYFLNEKTRIVSQDSPLSFDDIVPGQAVGLDFSRTDLGRELHLLRVPQLDELLENDYPESDELLYVSGVVTGVRPLKRTVTIHGPKLSQRMTLHVPDAVRITLQEKPIKLNKVKPGDLIEFEYQDLPEGFTITKGVLVRPLEDTTSAESNN